MRVNTEILLSFIASFLLFMGGFIYIWQHQQNSLAEVQKVRAVEFKATFDEIVTLRNSALKSFNFDYTYWDEMVSFVDTKNKVWAEQNLITSMDNFKYDYVAVYDANNKIIYYNQKDSSLVNIKEKLPLFTIDVQKPVFTNYFLANGDTPIQIFSAPIQPSSDTKRVSKPKGYMVIGKVWTKDYISDFAKITKQTVSSANENESQKYDFLYPLKSADGTVVANIGVRLNSTTLEVVNQIFASQLFFILILGFALTILIGVLMYYIVAKPLRTISKVVERRDTAKLAKLIGKEDELGDIARAVSEFFKQTAILEQYKTVIDAGYIVSKTDKLGIITYANKEFERISGYKSEELIGQNHNIVRHPDNSKELFAAVWSKISSGKIFMGIIKNRSKNGAPYYVRTVIAPIFDENGEIEEYIGIRTDITEMFEQMDIIVKQTTDHLTGLPNKQQLGQDMENEDLKSLILLNISGFRGINESYGYEAGDTLLSLFAARLQKMLAYRAAVYRVSADEFAVLLKDFEEHEPEAMVGELVKEIESEPFLVNETNINLRVTIAVASGNELVREKCDMAMNYAKAHNISMVDFDKNTQIKEELERSKAVTTMIQDAIKLDFVKPFGQKVVSVADKQSYKVETLMRIVGNDGKVISPFIFLEQAKHSRLYTKLTKIMIKKCFDYFRNNNTEFSINLTFEDISDKETIDELFALIEEYNMQGRVIVELVESENISATKAMDGFIERAKSYGCKISIDDFGSGYSNFEYLLTIGADFLKIDGSLIKNIDRDKNAYITVKTIVSLAKEIGLKVVAEYVHSQDVQDTVESLGIDFLQGFHLHQPEPLEKIA